MTAVVGLVLVGNSGFVELQLILNGLTGENRNLCSFCRFKETEAHSVAPLIQASVKGPLTLGISRFLVCYSFKIQQIIQGCGKRDLLCGEHLLPGCLPHPGRPHLARQAQWEKRGD